MKLAFSTLGCPDWRWSDIYSTAKDLKFDGIEVRGVANELFVPNIRAFNSENIDKTISKLNEGNIEIPILTSGISIGCPTDQNFSEAVQYIDLAQKLSSKYIRIMISSKPQPENVDFCGAIEMYSKICEYAKGKGVIPLIETNGVLSDSRVMCDFIEKTESENKGVLWDLHHPFRFFGEDPQDTFLNIGKYVKHVHLKDSIIRDDVIVYRMMGYGDVPVFDALKALKENGYNGYLSLEWVKRWNPDLEEPGIVIAHFKDYISFMLERL